MSERRYSVQIYTLFESLVAFQSPENVPKSTILEYLFCEGKSESDI